VCDHRGVNRFALLSALSLLFLGQGCWWFCIAEGSLISTPTGRCRIEQLREGDAIYSVDTHTGVLVEARITAIRRSVRECMSLELCGGERLRCTPDHPIYHPGTDSYRLAGEWITSGATTVSRVVEGRVIEQAVRSVSAYAGLMEVFDLSVDGPHANFIADGVVVHNKSPNKSTSEGTDDYSYDTGSLDSEWLEDTPEIPCDVPIPAGHLCLTIESREYQLERSHAAISDDGTVMLMAFEASGDGLPRFVVSYAADAVSNVSCEDPDTLLVLDFPDAHASTNDEDTLCLLSIGAEPASPGATLSGSLSSYLQEAGESYSVEAEWVDILVEE
jgi:hypothetical protein